MTRPNLLTEEVDAEIAGNEQNNHDYTDDGEDAHAALISLRSGELRFHHAFTLVDVIRSAYWTLGEGIGRRPSASAAPAKADAAYAPAQQALAGPMRRAACPPPNRPSEVTIGVSNL